MKPALPCVLTINDGSTEKMDRDRDGANCEQCTGRAVKRELEALQDINRNL
jgi:hypothetical protein